MRAVDRKPIYDRIVRELDVSSEISDEELWGKIDEVLLDMCRHSGMTCAEKRACRTRLFAAFRRFDILSLALDDEEVSEVMVNGSRIYVERKGRTEEFPETFTTPEKLGDIVQMIASAVNRRVNEASPMVDARLPDGSRVNVVLPPVAIDGPAVTVRRFPKEPVSMDQLIEWGSLTAEAASFLKEMVECGYNIFISGGTGAGKTTFLGALAEYIPSEERVITIEDSAELRLRNVSNLVRLESRPPTQSGEYEITIRDLIRNALRMRPDRVIIGEIRGGEAIDMLQAMNTGHDGSLSTGHANSALDMLSRMETMCLMGDVELPLAAIRAQIASGIDIMIHLGRLRDRSRRVLGIYEVAGVSEGMIRLQSLYEFVETGDDDGKIAGELRKTTYPLTKQDKLKRHGHRL